MSIEIERKFLLPEVPAWPSNAKVVRIEQGYLAIEEEVEVRLRRTEEKCLLTGKRGHGEVREEIEISLDREQSGNFEPPAWLGDEITGDQRYAGQSLALHDPPSV